jgi:paraquat-inducible protein A
MADYFPSEIRRLQILLAVASISLAFGLVAPIITLKKYVVVKNTFSVLGGAVELLRQGQFFLFIVVTGFSVVLPILKLILLFRLMNAQMDNRARFQRYLKLMHEYGKWSMLDVFVVAILVVSVKLGVIANIQMKAGLYAFATAVLLMMYATSRIVALTNKLVSIQK